MKVIIKFKECSIKHNAVHLLTDGEDFYEMLDKHSPNLLINYLNKKHNMCIAHLPKKKTKGGEQWYV